MAKPAHTSLSPVPRAGGEWVSGLVGWLRQDGHDSLARKMAGTAFLIRLVSAASLYLTQILLARWMGGSEFGTYVYVWTWTLLVGDMIHLGLGSVAPRFIPQYAEVGRADLLRGFIRASSKIVIASAAAAMVVAATAITLARPVLDPGEVVPLYLACLVLPAYALSILLDGVARSYNWMAIALMPPYVLRPLILVALMAGAHGLGQTIDAVTVMTAAVVAAWTAMGVQLAGLVRPLGRAVGRGPRAAATGEWMGAALPVLMVLGFFALLSSTDVLVLRQFRAPGEVAIYYAATKTLALVAFVYFAVGAAVAHRFAGYHAAGERERLAGFVALSVRWTFWPSLAVMGLVLALGWPILWLFGPDFVAGYPLMFIFAVGLLARASVGPAERLLNMVGGERACAGAFAVAFAVSLCLCLVLVPAFGSVGAAAATASALVAESAMLWLLVRSRLGIDIFIVAAMRRVTRG